MGLFDSLFSAKTAESVAFIEIAADSVGGAYASIEAGTLPRIIYTKRISLELRKGEEHVAALSQALTQLGEFLINEGAPALQRSTGSGSVSRVIASIAAPWEQASVRVENVESEKPFTFTHHVLKDALARSSVEPAGMLLVDEVVIATMLNGYETHVPVGKRVSRANIVILAASVDEAVGKMVAESLRALYHTHDTRLTAFARVAYEGLRTLFPHEEEYLAIEVRAGITSLFLVKRGCLVGATTIPLAPEGWLPGLKAALDALAIDHPLPHTLFLLANKNERDALRQAIMDAHFETLWLSEGPPRVLPLTDAHLAPLLAYAPATAPDLFISLLVLFYKDAVYSVA